MASWRWWAHVTLVSACLLGWTRGLVVAQEDGGFVRLHSDMEIAELEVRGDVRYDRTARRVVLESLARRAGLSLTYRSDLPGLEAPVTLSLQGTTLARALLAALEDTEITLLVSPAGVAVLVEAPGARIVGTVEDALSGRPLAGCEVRVTSGGDASTRTDRDGHFTLTDVEAGEIELRFTSPGRPGAVVRRVTVPARGEVALQVLFHPPAVTLPEVVVTTGRFGVLAQGGGTASFTHEEALSAPQIGEDVLRVVERVPGVSSDDVTARLSVRGAWPEELRIVLDGMVLYEPYHLRDVDAALSIVDVNAMGSVDLVAGGATVEHADALGGVLDLETVSDARSVPTSAGLTVSSVGVLAARDFDGGRGAGLLSVRRGYVDLLLDLGGSDDRVSPSYYDVLGKVEYRTGDRSHVSAHVLHAGDDFRWVDDDDRSTARSSWRSSYGWLTLKVQPGRGLDGTTVASLAALRRDREGSASPDEVGSGYTLSDVRRFDEQAVRSDWRWRAGLRHLLKWGFEVRHREASYDYARTGRARAAAPPPGNGTRDSVDIERRLSGRPWGAYGAWRVRPVDPLTLEVGLRRDRFEATGESLVSPRMNAVLSLGARTTFRASWGRYLRAQRLDEIQVQDGVRDVRTPERATQVVVGLDRTIRPGLSLRLEAYRRTVDRPRPVFVNLLNGLEVFPEATSTRIRIDPEMSLARGLELSMWGKAAGGDLGWRASWTLAEAVDRVDGLDVPRRLDQRHAIQLDGTWTPSPAWRVAASWRFHTGWPTTKRRYSLVPGEDGEPVLTSAFGPVHGDRLPAYHRLDLRATRTFRVGEGSLELFVDVFNAYDRDNARRINRLPRLEDGVLRVREEVDPMLPILPTAGLRWTF